MEPTIWHVHRDRDTMVRYIDGKYHYIAWVLSYSEKEGRRHLTSLRDFHKVLYFVCLSKHLHFCMTRQSVYHRRPLYTCILNHTSTQDDQDYHRRSHSIQTMIVWFHNWSPLTCYTCLHRFDQKCRWLHHYPHQLYSNDDREQDFSLESVFQFCNILGPRDTPGTRRTNLLHDTSLV